MKEEISIELPLYLAFIQLKKLEKNQPNKGIDTESWLRLVEILHSGYALNSKEELLFFCKKLWLKPFHRGNAAINETVMEQVILENLQLYRVITQTREAETENKKTTGTTKPEKEKEKENGQEEEQADIPAAEEQTSQEKNIQIPKQVESTSLILNIEEQPAGEALAQQDYNHFFNDKKFKFNYSYLPVSPRFIEQTVRSLRYKVKGTGRPVIDVEATVKDAGSRGYFDKWLMSEEDDFVTMWTLFFDRGGSMLAFHNLQDVLAEAAFRGTIKNDGDIFYFRNVAEEYLYTNPGRTRSVPLEEIANGPKRNILIVSDAGAARGSFNEARVQDTYAMMYTLRKHRIAWLNPLPKERWKKSSAELIANFVNMFEPGTDYSDDLGNIVRLFKSKIVMNTVL